MRDFDWRKNAVKGLRSVAAGVAVAAALGALGALDTQGEVESLGIPKAIAPAIAAGALAVASMVRNWWKHG